jgi:tRNA dimethylallyltransferase
MAGTAELPSVIFLMGPTASGKTAAACWLADRFDVELVSVDSALVYCGLDIGTAKPGPALLQKYPHHLLDLRDPAASYSAAEFRTDALEIIDKIHARGRIPLLVGGTGLYFRVLEHGIAELPSGDRETRKRLDEELQSLGLAALHARLARIDPSSASRIHMNDPQRTVRALEVYELTGRTMSVLLRETPRVTAPFKVTKLLLLPSDRVRLHERIARRFQGMLAAGFINEVAGLRDRGDLGLDNSALRAVGYRAVWSYLAGEYDFAEMTNRGIIATRQLAKRQITWFSAVGEAGVVDCEDTTARQQLAMALKSHLQYNADQGR